MSLRFKTSSVTWREKSVEAKFLAIEDLTEEAIDDPPPETVRVIYRQPEVDASVEFSWDCL